MTKPSMNETYERVVDRLSNAGNPIVSESNWDHDVVVIVNKKTDIREGQKIKFIVKRDNGDHYQALLTEEAPVSKPTYYSPPNIPIHHDGKHGESVGDTRSKSHAFKPLKDRF